MLEQINTLSNPSRSCVFCFLFYGKGNKKNPNLCIWVCTQALAWVWTRYINVCGAHANAVSVCVCVAGNCACALELSGASDMRLIRCHQCVFRDGMLYSFTSNSLHIQFISQRGGGGGRERVKAKKIQEDWYKSDRRGRGGVEDRGGWTKEEVKMVKKS